MLLLSLILKNAFDQLFTAVGGILPTVDMVDFGVIVIGDGAFAVYAIDYCQFDLHSIGNNVFNKYRCALRAPSVRDCYPQEWVRRGGKSKFAQEYFRTDRRR